MTSNRDEAWRKLDRLGDALARDVDKLTNDELFREAADSHGNTDMAVSATRGVIEAAIAAHGKRRLMAARQAYKAHIDSVKSKVIEIPSDRKRALLDRFANNDIQLQEKLTMAARNETDKETDIDSFLEDLVELGVIDEEGNIR